MYRTQRTVGAASSRSGLGPIRHFALPRFTLAVVLVSGMMFALGCGQADEFTESTPDLSGVYEAKGLTVQAGHGRARPISGTIELRLEGDKYASEFKLETIYPVADESVKVAIGGKGHGVLLGNRMAGISASTLEFDTVLGLDQEGDEITSLHIVSTAVFDVQDDGKLVISLQNEPAYDDDYLPSVSLLTADRVSNNPAVASAPSD